MELEKYYFVTYKKLSNNPMPERSDYDVCFCTLARKGEIIKFCYELDSKKKLHVHVLYKMPKNTYIKNFILQGYRFNIRPIGDTIEDYNNVVAYMEKENVDETTLYLRDNYGF